MVSSAPHTSPLNTLSVDQTLNHELDSATEPLIVTLKNSQRIDALRVNLRARTSVVFNSSPIARIMRRDWNIVSAKLFLNALDRGCAEKIRENVVEFAWQTQDLLETVRSMPLGELDTSWMRPRLLDVQIIHPFAGQWLRAFQRYDEAYAILINAQKTGRLTPKQRWALTAPCQLAYIGFKATAMNLQLKTAVELLEEHAIL